MVRNKRIITDGYPFFITNVTHGRDALLLDEIDLFWRAIESTKCKIEFDLFAWVILPEHFHFITYSGDTGISEVLKKVKQTFAANFRKRHGLFNGSVWQKGFHDHAIRDEKDLKMHLHYIHWNPVKHGLVSNPFEYPHSSIMKFKDYYPPDWGMTEDDLTGDFGE